MHNNTVLHPAKLNKESDHGEVHYPRLTYDYVFDLKLHEGLKINQTICLTYLGNMSHYGNQVRLGLDAPKNIKILRLEVWAREQSYQHEVTLNVNDVLCIGEDIMLKCRHTNTGRDVNLGIQAPKQLNISKAIHTELRSKMHNKQCDTSTEGGL